MECKVIKRLICGDYESAEKKKCGCQSLEECSYNSENECKFDKTNCYLAKSRKAKKKHDYTNIRIEVNPESWTQLKGSNEKGI